MGYDLHMVITPPAADEAELPNSSGIAGYYRFNVQGMGMTVGALEWADAIYHGGEPAIPELEPGEHTEARVIAAIEALQSGSSRAKRAPTDEELAVARAYLQAHEAAVSSSSVKDDRMAAYKFQSNDGWLVTPDECTLLARKLRASAELIARDYFPDAGVAQEDGLRWILGFVRYNEIAAEYGGYRVR